MPQKAAIINIVASNSNYSHRKTVGKDSELSK